MLRSQPWFDKQGSTCIINTIFLRSEVFYRDYEFPVPGGFRIPEVCFERIGMTKVIATVSP
ncbi:MAG: hypothetical protein LKK08_01040 [Bacteroidales bacterium]|nr:hypothetical protein [Bacteroidales bacterium]